MQIRKTGLLMAMGLILGFSACWSLIYFFDVKPSTHGLFYYQVRHPYEKSLGKEEMAKMDSLTVIFRQIIYNVYIWYYRDVSLDKISDDLFKRQKTVLDKHTAYLTTQEVLDANERIHDKGFGGIGVHLVGVRVDSVHKDKTRVTVDYVFPQTPAERSGLLKRDTIISVNGQEVFLAEQAKNLIRGKIDTKVLLTIIRPGYKDTLRLAIERKIITTPAVTWNLVKEDTSIGLIKINSFSKLEPSLFRLAVATLKVLKADKFIIDVRGNSGGLFGSFLFSCFPLMDGNDTLAVGVSGKTKDIYDSTYVAKLGEKNPGRFKDLKLVCLVNNSTGSAAEFFAKTMQCWGHPLVGEPTYGVSTMLYPLMLMDGSEIDVAWQKIYFGGKQEEIPDTGVLPNFVVRNDPASEKDLQMEKAIEILQKGVGKK